MRKAEHSATTVGMVELTIEQLSRMVDCSLLAREVRALLRTWEVECRWQQHLFLGGLLCGQFAQRR